MRSIGVVSGLALAIAVAGCGSSAPCSSSSPCATVIGVVERCAVPATRRCTPEQVSSVSLLDTKGRVVETAFGAQRHTLSTFLFIVGPGRYELETEAARQRIIRLLTLRAGKTRANLILEVK